MRIIIFIILATLSVAFQMNAQESNNSSSKNPVGLEVHQNNNNSSHSVHRTPVRINIEVFYDSESHTIEILNNGNSEGETFLYLNDNLIEYVAEINTSFYISASGQYKIEIVTDNWTAIGYLSL